ncbi:uncharacterized protein LOC127156669 [Labeo rohita]|uniref:uncharacterized protein LOC127156669 n=1 Tax=Labeo rohita TaxID=84645 RepID=UPI0021E1D061|nr:uncharacterized protein LOC127156669 [Labeo rohita]
MESNNTKANRLLILVLAFYITSTEAFHDEALRILIVGIRGQSRFSAADLLSGREDGGQEDRKIVKTPVFTDEGRRMMLVTGPNLCEEDTVRQAFTMLYLSSPGPHAVLMVLNLEDQQSQQCDIVKRAQELLGAEVLQYCIVLLLKNNQEHLTEASREMINACEGRFYIIKDSEPKPAQTAALAAEIDKIVSLNGDRFYSVLKETQQLEPESNLSSVIYTSLGEAVGIVGWISLSALVIYSKLRHTYVNSVVKFAALVLFMINLRNVLQPVISIPLNLALVSSLATILQKEPREIKETFTWSQDTRYIIGDIIAFFVMVLVHDFIKMMHLPFVLGAALVLGTIVSIRTWSDVLIACYAASGVSIGGFAFVFYEENISRESSVFALEAFLCYSVGETLSVGFVNVLFAQLGVKMTISVLILGFTTVCLHLNDEHLQNVICSIFITVVFPCLCVFIGSVFPILGLVMSF